MKLADWSGDVWVTAFNDPGEVLLGITADELARLQETDINKYLGKLDEASLKSFIFRLRVRRETFNVSNTKIFEKLIKTIHVWNK